MTLVILTMLLSGCAGRGKAAVETLPPFPEPSHEFVRQGNINCLDAENSEKYMIWLLGLESYKGAVEELRER